MKGSQKKTITHYVHRDKDKNDSQLLIGKNAGQKTVKQHL